MAQVRAWLPLGTGAKMAIRIPEAELPRGARTTQTPRQQISVPAPIEGKGFEILGRGLQQLGRGGIVAGRRQEAKELREQKKREIQAQKEQNQVDRIGALSGLRNLNDNWQDLNNVYYGNKGREVIGTFEPYEKELDSQMDTIRGELLTPESQAMFDTFASPRRNTNLNKARNHQRTEIARAEQDEWTATFKRDKQFAMENPEELLDSKARLRLAIEGATPGASTTERKQIYESTLSDVHKEIISQYVIRDPDQAWDWYKKHKKEILPSERPEIESRIKKHEVRRTSQAEADRITTLITAKDGTLADAKAENKKRNEGKIRDEVDKRLKNNWADAKVIEKDTKQNLKDNIIATARNATSLNQALDAVSVQGLTGTDQDDLEKTIYAMWARRTKTKPKKPIVTDRAEMVRIRKMIDDGEILTENHLLVEVGNSANDAAWQRMLKYFNDSKKKLQISDATYGSVFRRATGIPPVNAVDDYDRAFEYVQRQAEAEDVKKPTDLQLRNWTMEWQLKSEEPGEMKGGIGFGRGEDITWGKATDEQRKTWLPVVSEEEEEALNEQIRATGEPPPYSDFMLRLFKRVSVLGFDFTDELKAEFREEAGK